jgi:hypothetical protein
MNCATFSLAHSLADNPQKPLVRSPQLCGKGRVSFFMTVGPVPSLWRWLMLTTALNTLVLIRVGGLRLAHSGWDGFGPLMVGLGFVGVAIWALSRLHDGASTKN